jgi:hypothetical protein
VIQGGERHLMVMIPLVLSVEETICMNKQHRGILSTLHVKRQFPYS